MQMPYSNLCWWQHRLRRNSDKIQLKQYGHSSAAGIPVTLFSCLSVYNPVYPNVYKKIRAMSLIVSTFRYIWPSSGKLSTYSLLNSLILRMWSPEGVSAGLPLLSHASNRKAHPPCLWEDSTRTLYSPAPCGYAPLSFPEQTLYKFVALALLLIINRKNKHISSKYPWIIIF